MDRQHAVRAVGDALAAQRAVVVRGERGTGRSWAAARVAGRLRDDGHPVHEVAGDDGRAGVPLAPFAAVIARHLEPGDALATYTALPHRLVAAGATVVVDDAELLDGAASVLVGHLARAEVPIALFTADVERLPRAVQDGLSRGGWALVDLPPPTPDELLHLAADEAGGHLTAAAGADLLARAAGRPAVVVDLVRAARDRAVDTPAGRELDLPVPVPAGVRRWSIDVAALGTDEARAAQVLAVAGDLPGAALPELRGLDALLTAEVAVEDSGRVRLRGRLDVDVVLASIPAALHPHRAAEAHDLLVKVDGPGAPRTVLAAVRAGLTVPPDDAVAAATSPELSAVEREAVLAALPAELAETHLLRGAHASATGRTELAVDHLARARTLIDGVDRVTRDPLLLRLGQELGLLHAVRLGDAAAAVAEVRAVHALIEDPGPAAVLEAELVKWRLMSGEPGVSAPRGQSDDVHAGVRVGSAVIGAMVASLDGGYDEARAEVDAGLAALAGTTVPPPHAESLLRLSEYLAFVFDGRLAEADALVTLRRDRAVLAADPELGMWEYAAAELALHTGRTSLAAQLVYRAVRHLAWRDFTGLRPTALALAAAAQARLGRGRRSEWPSDAERADVKVELPLARAEADLDRAAGAEALLAAARRARSEMHGNLALLAADDAWMLTRSDAAADEVRDHAGRGRVADLLAARVTAARRESAYDLTACATELERVGLAGRAADAWELAAGLHRSRRRSGAAADAARAATLLRSAHDLGDWPEPAVALSPRETEIARLAAQRVRSREIGELLGLSVRTVDNHLARVYRKLGVAGRDELAALLPRLTEG